MPLAFGVNDFVSDAVGKEVRRCPVKGYGIYYLVNDEEEVVYVVAFAHIGRDVPRMLQED